MSLGVVLAAEKKEASKLFVPTRESGKLYKMDDHIIMSVSGVVADANFLIDYGRLQCQRHLYSHKEPIYVEELVKYLCNYKHVLPCAANSYVPHCIFYGKRINISKECSES